MADETPLWLQEYRQPFRKRKDTRCHSDHRHRVNLPAVGFVLVRLNTSSQLELLLDLRSQMMATASIFGFIGGFASNIGEDPLATALRAAREAYNIKPEELNVLGLQYKHDHGGYKFLQYTYVFAEYNPKDGQAPVSHSAESVRSQWFTLDALPTNLFQFIREDHQMLVHTLQTGVLPMLLKTRNIQAPQNSTGSMNTHVQGDIADIAMADVGSNTSVPKEAPINTMTSVGSPGQTILPTTPPRIEQAATSRSGIAGRFVGESSISINPNPVSSGQVKRSVFPQQSLPPSNSANVTAVGQGQVQYPLLPTQATGIPAQKGPAEATSKSSNTWQWPSTLSSVTKTVTTSATSQQRKDQGKTQQVAPALGPFPEIFGLGGAKPAAKPAAEAASTAPSMAQLSPLRIRRVSPVQVSSNAQLGPTSSVAPKAFPSGTLAPAAPAPAPESSMTTLMTPFVPPLDGDRGPEYETERQSRPKRNSRSYPASK